MKYCVRKGKQCTLPKGFTHIPQYKNIKYMQNHAQDASSAKMHTTHKQAEQACMQRLDQALLARIV
jgi:hypothetical protein